ncbi:MAG: hypothetical protein HY958_03380 [Bacteroidia bacterium]|nr:hypothetical protein [Bacteroidia bacterium]
MFSPSNISLPQNTHDEWRCHNVAHARPPQTCHLEQFDWLTVSPAERRMVLHTHTHTHTQLL